MITTITETLNGVFTPKPLLPKNILRKVGKKLFVTISFNPKLNMNISTKKRIPIDIPKDELWDITGLLEDIVTPSSYERLSKTAKDLRRYEENVFASVIMKTDYISLMINELVNLEIEVIDKIRVMLLENLETTVNNARSFTGGHENKMLNEQIVAELAIKEGDSQHDFGKPERNAVWPIQIYTRPNLTDKSRIILEQIEKILANSNSKRTNAGLLYNYFKRSPGAFEETIKVTYFMGLIAGNLDDISYYFTAKHPSNWSSERKSFFQDKQVSDNIQQLYDDMKKYGIDYYLYDACLEYIAGNRNKDNLPTKVRSIAEIWDPSENGSLDFPDLFENIFSQQPANRAISVLVEDKSIPKRYGLRIMDWRNPSAPPNTNPSYYDLVYNDLLNIDILTEKSGMIIKLRVAVNDEGNDVNYSSSGGKRKIITQRVDLALCLFKNNVFVESYIIKGGFSVAELVVGMHYIETLREETESGETSVIIKDQEVELDSTLHILLHDMFSNFRDIRDFPVDTKKGFNSLKFFQNEYIKLLFRFKSSGDHGQAKLVKVLNDVLNKKTMFMTGDNLAGVYSIADEIPTVCSYHMAGKTTFFIVGYFPLSESPEKYRQSMNQKISTIGRLANPEFENPNHIEDSGKPSSISQEQFSLLKEYLKAKTRENEMFCSELERYNSFITLNDSSFSGKKTELERLIQRRIDLLFNTEDGADKFNMIIDVPNNMDLFLIPPLDALTYNYNSLKEYNKILSDFLNSCYFIRNYIKIMQLIKKNIEETVKKIGKGELFEFESDNIFNDTVPARESRTYNGITFKAQSLVKEFSRVTGQVSKAELDEKLATMQSWQQSTGDVKYLKTTFDTFVTNLNSVKRELLKKLITEFSKGEPRSEPHVREIYNQLNEKIENIRGAYIDKLREKIKQVPKVGEALNEYFDNCFAYTKSGSLGSIEDLAAKNASDSDIKPTLDEMDLPTERTVGNLRSVTELIMSKEISADILRAFPKRTRRGGGNNKSKKQKRNRKRYTRKRK